jgi:hypothetical protein
MAKVFSTIPVDAIAIEGLPNADSGVTVIETDGSGLVVKGKTTSIPVSTAGYTVGCELIKSDAANGQCATWRNHGTASSCSFRPVGPVIGYGFNAGAGAVACSNGVTAFTYVDNRVRAQDIQFLMYSGSDDTDSILAQKAADQTVGATLSADPLVAHSVRYATLRPGCVPEFDIFAAGKHTTVGGQVYNDITVTGVTSSDLLFVCYSASDDSDVIAKATYQAANTIRVTMSADPLVAHELSYVVLRPRGSFKPSHYVYAAGIHTTVGGAAAEPITIAGLLSTDIPIVYYNVTDDTDKIIKAVPTANTLTVTMTADPLVAHALAYMIVRAY